MSDARFNDADSTADRAIRDLPAVLDLAVFEQISATVFKPAGRLPN